VLHDQQAGRVGRHRLEDRAQRFGAPVDAPSARTLSVVVASAVRLRSGSTASAARAGTALRAARGRTRARAASVTVAWNISAESRRKPLTPSRGFSITATAPMSTARSAASVPLAASPEQTTTGIGSVVISRSRNDSPSISGISRSSTITCGRERCIFSSAISGCAAVVTVTRGSLPRIS
jgi:hypothetical protein